MDLEILKSKSSWHHAWRGVRIVFKNTRNLLVIHLPVYLVIVSFGFYFCVSSYEWTSLVLSIGLMLVSEAFNSAIEVHMGMTSPEYHPHARDTKDIAAGAVLLSGFVALAVFTIIFLPKIMFMVQ